MHLIIHLIEIIDIIDIHVSSQVHTSRTRVCCERATRCCCRFDKVWSGFYVLNHLEVYTNDIVRLVVRLFVHEVVCPLF